MKFSFHKTVNENDNGLVLRVNIPGLDIYPVSNYDNLAFGVSSEVLLRTYWAFHEFLNYQNRTRKQSKPIHGKKGRLENVFFAPR